MDSRIRDTDLPAAVMPCVSPQKLLKGQKALVTGASSGIGRAVALSLGDAGADVVINYVAGEDKAEALAEEIRAKGGKAVAVQVAYLATENLEGELPAPAVSRGHPRPRGDLRGDLRAG